jgi:hypothetical protein
MSWKMLGRAILILTVAACLDSVPAAAQDCGEFCNGCPGNGWKEGTSFHPDGTYNMSCTFVGIGNPCVECEVPGADDFVASEIVAHAVQSAPVSDLELVVAAYGDRLLFSPERGAVFVIGVPCDHRRISKMVFISRDQARGIEALGVTSLAAFLEAQVAEATVEELPRKELRRG